MPNFIKEIIENSAARGSRSSALQPLLIVLGILAGLVPSASWAGVSEKVLYMLIGLVVFVLCIIVICYVVFMVKSPDALRSERFQITKMAIDRGLIGDDLVGMDSSTGGRGEPVGYVVDHETEGLPHE